MKLLMILTLFVSNLVVAHGSLGQDDLDYFKQFLYKKTNISTDPAFPTYQYRYLMAGYGVEIPVSQDRWLLPQVSLYLYADGRYILDYREDFKIIQNGREKLEVGACRRFKGHWQVPNELLVLDNIATGDRLFKDERHQVKITFLKGLISGGIKGKSLDFDYGYSNSGPEKWYCF